MAHNGDVDPQETREWLEALDGGRAPRRRPSAPQQLLERVVERARRRGVPARRRRSTRRTSTRSRPTREAPYPRRPRRSSTASARSIRWNAIAMVLQANKESSELGGHIASYQSAATLYEVGFNHFWHAPTDEPRRRPRLHPGPLVARHLRARVPRGPPRARSRCAASARRSRRAAGSSSYPHPWLMPDFWQFPTVSMGLGPLMAIYQARFMKYLQGREHRRHRRAARCGRSCGDGEMDEPESLGAISLAGRERLDNLIFVVNCNLQRLDGPVRGNGKIIQELETNFRGAGWNVIKVDLGRALGPAARRRPRRRCSCGAWRRRVDGEYQTYKSRDGAYVREHFFGAYPELRELVARHDRRRDLGAQPRRPRPAARSTPPTPRPSRTRGQPTVILAKTIKGYGMGEAGEGQNITHQQKKMNEAALLAFRDRFELAADRRAGRATARSTSRRTTRRRWPTCASAARRSAAALPRAGADAPSRWRCRRSTRSRRQLEGTGEREISTTMAFVRILAALVRDKQLGPRVVPIVPDESRTFGMEGMFRQLGIFSQVGPALPARGPRAAHVLPRGQEGPDPPGGHQRGRARSRRGSPRRRRTPTTACR